MVWEKRISSTGDPGDDESAIVDGDVRLFECPGGGRRVLDRKAMKTEVGRSGCLASRLFAKRRTLNP